MSYIYKEKMVNHNYVLIPSTTACYLTVAGYGFFLGAYGSLPDAAIWGCLRTGGGGVLTRRRGIKDGYNKKQERILSQRQKEAVTVGQASYYMDGIFCKRGTTDGHFGRGDNEKGLIIGARYWGLEIPASEVGGDGLA
jgi:hypothetical protein